MTATHPPLSGLARYAWTVLAYNVLVVLWGAYVRATGSGAGCGRHWPRCNGRVVPRLGTVQEVIEFTHRASSGVALVLVFALLAWTFRALPAGHPARRGSAASAVLIVTEAALGAGLVLLRLVENDASRLRAVSISLHLVNTFLLLGALALTAWWASGGAPLALRARPRLAAIVAAPLAAVLLVAISGAITALGDTLFPAASLSAGLRADLDPTANFLIRLRVVHPILAVGTGLIVVAAGWAARRMRPTPAVTRLSAALVGLFFLQLGAGTLNVALLAPVWLQIVHLLLADLVWITLVLLGASALGAEPAAAARGHKPAGAAAAAHPA